MFGQKSDQREGERLEKRMALKKVDGKFDSLNGYNRPTISGFRTKFPTSLLTILQKYMAMHVIFFILNLTAQKIRTKTHPPFHGEGLVSPFGADIG